MGCLPQQLDGLDLLAVPGQRLELQGELGIELASGQDRTLVAGLPDGGCVSRLGAQRLTGVICLL